jgi:hypothetical protein
MRLTASDFVSYRRPTACDLRVFLRHRQEQEVEPGPYGEVLRRLGVRHEKSHLATLGAFVDVSDASLNEQAKKTADAIAKRVHWRRVGTVQVESEPPVSRRVEQSIGRGLRLPYCSGRMQNAAGLGAPDDTLRLPDTRRP